MSKYTVQFTRTGKYAVTDGTETLATMHCPHAAQAACDALNYEPGKNPFDVYCRGRFADEKLHRISCRVDVQ